MSFRPPRRDTRPAIRKLKPPRQPRPDRPPKLPRPPGEGTDEGGGTTGSDHHGRTPIPAEPKNHRAPHAPSIDVTRLKLVDPPTEPRHRQERGIPSGYRKSGHKYIKDPANGMIVDAGDFKDAEIPEYFPGWIRVDAHGNPIDLSGSPEQSSGPRKREKKDRTKGILQVSGKSSPTWHRRHAVTIQLAAPQAHRRPR